MQTKRWVEGPPFLRELKEGLPMEPKGTDDDEVFVVARVSNQGYQECGSATERFISAASSWQVLCRRLGWWCRLWKWISLGTLTKSLTAQEILSAEKRIVKYVQHVAFAEEMENVLAGKEVKSGSRLSSLYPGLMDGILCVQGRLRKAECEGVVKNPWILPSTGHVVDLIISCYHEKSGHMGVWCVLTQLRERFWIIHGVRAVRRVLARCIVCKKVKARVMKQKMADLPIERVRQGVKAFEVTGVDCFGPMEVKMGRSRARVKRWVALFTCLAI